MSECEKACGSEMRCDLESLSCRGWAVVCVRWIRAEGLLVFLLVIAPVGYCVR